MKVIIPSAIEPAIREAERIEAGGKIVRNEVAALIRHQADMTADYWRALAEEREQSKYLRNKLMNAVDTLRVMTCALSALGVVAQSGGAASDGESGPEDWQLSILAKKGELRMAIDERLSWYDMPAPKKRTRKAKGATKC